MTSILREWGDALGSRIRGFRPVAAATNVITREAATVTVDNDVTETDLFSYTIPAATLSLDHAVGLRLWGDLLNDSGGAVNFTWRIYFAGVEIWDSGALSLADATPRGPWFVDIILAAADSDAAQILVGRISIDARVAAATGEGSFSTAAYDATILSDAAEDATVDQVLAVSIEMGTADAAAEISARYAILEEF